ncbi:hypothetical protein RA27_22345 [Ruegeria sp. ANG-R]|nr:hypothetical protein RA27_22345 [Ruegeria sp. ANG-R]
MDRFVWLVSPLRYSGPALKLLFIALLLSVPYQLIGEMNYVDYIVQLRDAPGNENMTALQARVIFWLDLFASLFSPLALDIFTENLFSTLSLAWAVLLQIVIFILVITALDRRGVAAGYRETSDRETILGLPGERVVALVPGVFALWFVSGSPLAFPVYALTFYAYFSLRVKDSWLGLRVDRVLGRKTDEQKETDPGT